MSRPLGVTIVTIVAWIVGLLEVLRGVLRLFTASDSAARADGDVTRLTIAAIVTIVVGIAVIVVAFGAFNGSNAARLALAIVLILLVGDALLALVYFPGEIVLAVIAGAVALAAFIALFTPQAHAYFTQPVRR